MNLKYAFISTASGLMQRMTIDQLEAILPGEDIEEVLQSIKETGQWLGIRTIVRPWRSGDFTPLDLCRYAS